MSGQHGEANGGIRISDIFLILHKIIVQTNFNVSNIFGTMENCSGHG